MAADSVIMVGWTRPNPGREQQSLVIFGPFLGWLGTMVEEGRIESFEPCALIPHGGDMTSFVLIRGEARQLDELTNSEDWLDWQTQGALNLVGFRVLRGRVGEGLIASIIRTQRFL